MINDNKTRKAILNHYKKYPQMQIEDLFKFLHQSAMGCEHLVFNEERVFNYLKNEFENNRKNCKIKIDKLNGDYSRLHLGYIKKGLSLTTLTKIFCLSAKTEEMGKENLKNYLKVALTLIKEKALPFKEDFFNEQVAEWEKLDFCAIHHSQTFRENYSPCYRVVNDKFIKILPLLIEIDKLALKNQPVLIAIDGGSASGKSTISLLLEQIYDCNVFHVDDFFLQPSQRTQERLKEIGGNFDKERLLKEIIIPFKNGEKVCYKKFNCSTQTLGEKIFTEQKNVNVIEGVYSMHPDLKSYYDFSVFLKISPSLQKRRINQRNSPIFANKYLTEWIPLENKYFDKYNIESSCNLILISK